jgi:glycosyltransferase involved in cell wall biosynthesis
MTHENRLSDAKNRMNRPLHLLHVFSTFTAAGPQIRTVQILNELGGDAKHTILAMDGDTEAAARIQTGIEFRIVPPPRRHSLCVFRTVRRLLRQLNPDLLLTYNWGAIEAAAANAWLPVCPALHTEDGFGPDEATKRKLRRNLARRVVLPRIYATVLPSRTLVRIAQEEFGLPEKRIRYIPNGVDVERFAPRDGTEMRKRLGIPVAALVFGYCGKLRAEKNLGLALQAFRGASRSGDWFLMTGGGPEQPTLERLARELGIEGRVVFTGPVANPAPYYNATDIFVMSSDTEQMPMAVLEAMASALPVVATAAGDIPYMVSSANSSWLVRTGDLPALTKALRECALHAEQRAAAGAANRRRVEAEFSLTRMLAAYRRLYFEAASAGRG